MRALINDTQIVQLVAAESDEFPVAPPLVWVAVADDTTTQDTYVDGAVVTFVVPDITFNAIRSHRDGLLATTDYTQLPNTALLPDKVAEFVEYRTLLRDLPASNSDPTLIVFPTPPTI